MNDTTVTYPSKSKYLIKRNTAIIKRYEQLKGEGLVTREIEPKIAKEFNEQNAGESISASLVRSVYFGNYKYSKEAWEAYEKERKAKKSA